MPSLNTGNAILSNAITVDSNYNLGIGTTSTSSESNIFLGAKSTLEGGQLTLQKGTTQTLAAHLDNYSDRFRIMKGTDTGSTAELMCVNLTSGNVGIGTIPQWNNTSFKALEIGNTGLIYAGGGQSAFVNNGYFDGVWRYKTNDFGTLYTTDSGQHAWYTVGSGTAGNLLSWVERMRILNNGNFLVGTSSDYGSRIVGYGASATSSDYSLRLLNSNNNNTFMVRNDGAIFTGTVAQSPYNNTTASGANLAVLIDGSLARSTSSLKYKTNVLDYNKGLSEVMQLRPVTYNGKGAMDADKTFAGLIAEEVHELGLTEFVQYAEDGTPDALAYGNMVSLLTKAIQEQQAMIEAQQQQINQLINK